MNENSFNKLVDFSHIVIIIVNKYASFCNFNNTSITL